ncbi:MULTISPECIES: fumarylacetoacetate hydrolase family protein [unclassified Sphingobium]|nr:MULTISPECIES: fumarylacetoacetate hydrolase family protein [unclassified Sphingobium]MBG6116389.1 2-keto-4-pentenoate hydratase/2-oxohepta-3-ene-1,7-dioic acid hydratase in catechol pathway [Sphingobium sp. JAI105]
MSWPAEPGDAIIAQLGAVLESGIDIDVRPSLDLSTVVLESPVARPHKIMGAPVNYHAHIEEANADPEINAGKTFTTLEAYGLFLKANSSLIGPNEPFRVAFADRRTDHEIELVIVIGKTARHVPREKALDYVAGYTAGLDMTVRGKETPCYRKSPDGYCVLGPWLVTPDEIGDPDDLALSLKVNGDTKQEARTSLLILGVARLIEYASALYTLHPGDVIMTGTPAGVGPVEPGDVIDASVENIGSLRISILPALLDGKAA